MKNTGNYLAILSEIGQDEFSMAVSGETWDEAYDSAHEVRVSDKDWFLTTRLDVVEMKDVVWYWGDGSADNKDWFPRIPSQKSTSFYKK